MRASPRWTNEQLPFLTSSTNSRRKKLEISLAHRLLRTTQSLTKTMIKVQEAIALAKTLVGEVVLVGGIIVVLKI